MQTERQNDRSTCRYTHACMQAYIQTYRQAHTHIPCLTYRHTHIQEDWQSG